jgi:hypothetical protein
MTVIGHENKPFCAYVSLPQFTCYFTNTRSHGAFHDYYGITFAILWFKICRMKKFLKILAGLFALTGVGIFIMRKINTRRKLKQVADNGYETAEDVLYPRKEIKSKKLHYGPVLPRLK